MQLKRILHHAGWFTLLGPFVGVPAGIVTLAFFEDGDIGQFYFDVARTLMLVFWRDSRAINRDRRRLSTRGYL